MAAFRRPLAVPVMVAGLVLAGSLSTPTHAAAPAPSRVATTAPALIRAATPPTPTRPATTRPATSRPAATTRSATTTRAVPPAEAELRAAFERGAYAQVVKEADRLAGLTGKAAEAYDRHGLLLLKGEAHLRLNQYVSAAAAFGRAAKATDDPVLAATARATQRLVAETKGPRVTRRRLREGERGDSADLLDPAQRDNALRIARDDLRVQAEAKVSEAMRATTIPTITGAMDLLWLKRDFELATNGSVDEDQRTRQELAGRVRDLIDAEIGQMQKQVDEIWAGASEVVGQYETVPSSNYVIQEYRGLSDGDRLALRDVVKTSTRILTTIKSLGRAAGPDAVRDPELMRQAGDLRRTTLGVMSQRFEDQTVPVRGR